MKLGDKVIGRWGAMIEEWVGEIVKINPTNQGTEVDVLWENGSMKYLMDFEIRGDYYAPEGTPIGVYRVEEA